MFEALPQKKPAGQVAGEVDPAGQKPVHAIWVVLLGQEKPAGHGELVVDPAGQNWPVTQGSWVEAFGQKEPAGHWVWAADPAGQKNELLQETTAAVELFGQKLPSGHGAHTVLDVAVQNDTTYWPGAHVPQAVQLAALDVVEKEVPATHAAHTASAVVVHALLRRVPAAQTEQVEGAVTPARQKSVPAVQLPVIPVAGLAQNLPAGQVWQTMLVVVEHGLCTNCPALHTPQLVQSAELDVVVKEVPATHEAHTALAVVVHWLTRRAPAAQTEQAEGVVTPARQKLVPAVQLPVTPVAGLAQKLPAGHVSQTMSVVGVQAVRANWPEPQVLQAVQVAASDVVEYEVPATHAVHTVSAAAVHTLLRRVPELQVLQVLQLAELDVVENEVPATHGAHTALAVVVHALTRCVPAAQTEQAEGVVTPVRQKLVPAVQLPVIPVTGLAQKLPAGHVSQTMSVVEVQAVCANWPEPQVLQAVQVAASDVVEYEVPATQVVHTAFAEAVHALLRRVPAAQVLQAVHVVELDVVEKEVPATHGSHTASDVALHARPMRVPATQTVQEARVAGVVQKKPEGQGASTTVPSGHQLVDAHWTWDDGVAQTKPARHLVWTTEPMGQKKLLLQTILVDGVGQWWPTGQSTHTVSEVEVHADATNLPAAHTVQVPVIPADAGLEQ